MLTAAIAIAMNTTAFGLMVAIPTMFLSLILNTLVKKILMQQLKMEMLQMLMMLHSI